MSNFSQFFPAGSGGSGGSGINSYAPINVRTTGNPIGYNATTGVYTNPADDSVFLQTGILLDETSPRTYPNASSTDFYSPPTPGVEDSTGGNWDMLNTMGNIVYDPNAMGAGLPGVVTIKRKSDGGSNQFLSDAIVKWPYDASTFSFGNRVDISMPYRLGFGPSDQIRIGMAFDSRDGNYYINLKSTTEEPSMPGGHLMRWTAVPYNAPNTTPSPYTQIDLNDTAVSPNGEWPSGKEVNGMTYNPYTNSSDTGNEGSFWCSPASSTTGAVEYKRNGSSLIATGNVLDWWVGTDIGTASNNGNQYGVFITIGPTGNMWVNYIGNTGSFWEFDKTTLLATGKSFTKASLFPSIRDKSTAACQVPDANGDMGKIWAYQNAAYNIGGVTQLNQTETTKVGDLIGRTSAMGDGQPLFIKLK